LDEIGRGLLQVTIEIPTVESDKVEGNEALEEAELIPQARVLLNLGRQVLVIRLFGQEMIQLGLGSAVNEKKVLVIEANEVLRAVEVGFEDCLSLLK